MLVVACSIPLYGRAHTRKTHTRLWCFLYFGGVGRNNTNMTSFTLMLAALAAGGLPELDLANVSLLNKPICPNPLVSLRL